MAVLPLLDDDAPASEKEKEKTRLEQELEAKSLRELMASQKAMEKEAEGKATVLHAVQHGDLSALKPYMQPSTDRLSLVTLRAEDEQRIQEILSHADMRQESFLFEVAPEHAERALEYNKKFLKETFPTSNTEVIIVKSEQGRTYLQTVGISFEEEHAALRLKDAQQEAATQSQAIKRAIEHKISQPSPQAPSLIEHEVISLAQTPQQKDTASRGRNLSV